jgi:hypothetical protein
MHGQRLTEQLQLAFTPADADSSATAGRGGAEPVVAKCEPERPAITHSLMEVVCERGSLKKALRRVKANKGSPGVDGMTVEQLPDYLRAHWPQHRDELLRGSYTPSPVRRVEIDKPEGGVRKLGIPTVLDRFIQQAVLQVLQPEFDPTFSDHSYGFRPGRSGYAVGMTRITGTARCAKRFSRIMVAGSISLLHSSVEPLATPRLRGTRGYPSFRRPHSSLAGLTSASAGRFVINDVTISAYGSVAVATVLATSSTMMAGSDVPQSISIPMCGKTERICGASWNVTPARPTPS